MQFEPPVLALLDEIISAEAQENEGDDEQVSPHHEAFVHHMKLELASQLATLGLKLPGGLRSLA